MKRKVNSKQQHLFIQILLLLSSSVLPSLAILSISAFTTTSSSSRTLCNSRIHHHHHSSSRSSTSCTSLPNNRQTLGGFGISNDIVGMTTRHTSTTTVIQMSSSSTNNNNNEEESSSSSKLLDNKIFTKIGSTTSSVVAITFFLILSYQRDTYMLTFFIGSILNGITSKVLKRILNQDRPEDGYRLEGGEKSIKEKPTDKGMPSSHAMSLGFIGIYTSIGLLNNLSTTGLLLGVSLISLWLYVIVSLVYRVEGRLHTTDQVYVGLFFGVMNGLLWHSLAHGTNPLFPNMNLMNMVSSNLLPDDGIMPIYFLSIPALIGATVVGSFERRIGRWFKNKSKDS